MTALASDSSEPSGRGYSVVAGDDDDQELEADAVPPNASASSPGESETSDPDTAVTGCTSPLLEESPYQDQGYALPCFYLTFRALILSQPHHVEADFVRVLCRVYNPALYLAILRYLRSRRSKHRVQPRKGKQANVDPDRCELL